MGSVSSCLRPRRLCDSVVVPLVILRQLSFIQIETAQRDCVEEDPTERKYCICDLNSASLSHPLLASSLASNSGSRGKTEVIVGEQKIGNF